MDEETRAESTHSGVGIGLKLDLSGLSHGEEKLESNKIEQKNENEWAVPPASVQTVYRPLHTDRSQQPPTTVRENWGPIYKLKYPDLSYSNSDERSEDEANTPSNSEISYSILEQVKKIKLADLKPSERIGNNYTPNLWGLSPRTFNEVRLKPPKTKEEREDEEEEDVSNQAQRPGRSYRRSSKSDEIKPAPPTTERKLNSPFSSHPDNQFIHREQDFLFIDQSKLPLEFFDTFEEQEVIQLPATARSPRYIEGDWVQALCHVQEYLPDQDRYIIQFFEDKKRKKVKRLSICFEEEDQRQFQERVQKCRELREECKKAQRYRHYLSCQPKGSSIIAPLATNWQERILELAVAVSDKSRIKEKLIAQEKLIKDLFGNLHETYNEALKHSIVSYKAKIPEELEKLRAKHLPVNLYIRENIIPDFGMVCTGASLSTKELKYKIQKSHISTIDNLDRCLLYARKTWLEKFNKCLFVDVSCCPIDPDDYKQRFPRAAGGVIVAAAFRSREEQNDQLSLPCTIDEFELLQDKHCSFLTKHLNESWRKLLLDNFHDFLYEEFNLFERNKDSYRNSTLFKFLTLTNLQMKDHLRATIKQTLRSWVSFVEFYTLSGKFAKKGAKEISKMLRRRSITSSIQTENASINDGNTESKESKQPIRKRRRSLVYSIPEPSRDDINCRTTEDILDLVACYFSPLLQAELRAKNTGEVYIYPSIESIKHVFLYMLERMKDSVMDIKRLDFELLPLLQLPQRPVFQFDSGLESSETDKEFDWARRRITSIIDEHMEPVLKIISLYEEFSPLLCIDSEKYVEELHAKNAKETESKGVDTQDDPEAKQQIDKTDSVQIDYETEILRMKNTIQEIEKKSHNTVVFGLVVVDCTNVKDAIASKASELAKAIMHHISKDAKTQSIEITNSYREMLERMKEVPTNEAKLTEIHSYIESSEQEIAMLESQFKNIQDRLSILENFSEKLEQEDDFSIIWSTRLWPAKIRNAAKLAVARLDRLSMKFMSALKDEQTEFEESLEEYSDIILQFHKYGDMNNVEKYAEEATTFQDRLQEASRRVQNFAEREETFGWAPTVYPLLEEAKEEFGPYFKLWSVVSYFEFNRTKWLEGPFINLKASEVEEMVLRWWKEIKGLRVHFEGKNLDEPLKVVNAIFEKLGEFKEKLPLIQSLASPALRKMHWLQISGLLREKDLLKQGQNLEPDDELSLSYMLDTIKIQNCEEEISQVRQVAEKEYSLEKSLDEMMLEWEVTGVKYDMVPYKDSETHILRDVEEVITLLDDQVTKVQTMRGSPYIKPIESRAKAWEQKLHYTQQLLDEWLTLQRTWLYLQPIFDSEDMMRQMPDEARKFKTVDTLFRKSMMTIHNQPAVMEVSDIGISATSENTSSLLNSFQKANEKLEDVQQGLSKYLETKRLAFPRFFFLSNEELLEILSQTKDPRAVQPHMNKSFEGINNIKFSDTSSDDIDLEITAMLSSEGEQVDFLAAVKPNIGAKKGNVELWMVEVEQQMLQSVSANLDKSLVDYENTVRNDWVLKWPGQIVLCANQIFWTKAAEKILNNDAEEGKDNSMEAFSNVLSLQLNDIVNLVRGNLTKLNRKTLGALVVIDVHARDTIQELVDKKTSSVDEFEWQAQLRYYYNALSDGQTKKKTISKPGRSKNNKEAELVNRSVQVKITNASQYYGFEYLGNSSRLVITPLTDRCYRTLTGAISLNYGGAPSGPAGTGKTESTKDLAKALGMQCVVFNCSDGLDYRAMAKFFKGLAASGAWACFDEFNRIEIEVLSVVGQQIATIQNAKKAGSNVFDFEGTTKLPIRSTCNVFITMNPGYAGRSELPDNLQALFRPCAMMVPNYAMIAEIVLYSYGFSNARSMARKITQVLRLCSEQLSSQDHYDYGMRTVKTILDAAGILKQADKKNERDESELVLCAISNVNLPKFTISDIPLFEGIVQDLFPSGTILEMPNEGELFCSLTESIKSSGLQPKREFLNKCFQLHETVKVRHGLMLVGEACSGKTSVLRNLATAYTTLSNKIEKDSELSEYSNVSIFTMNPKAVTQSQLYGCFNENTHEWEDGVLAVTIRSCSRDTSKELKWVVFDGPVDAVWIENMNTVLDDNKKLCLNSGEIIRLTDEMTMIYEVEDLKVASPATVSRCGMVYLEAKELGWKPLVASFINARLPERISFYSDYVKDLFDWMIEPALNIIFDAEMERFIYVYTSKQELVLSMLNLFSAKLKSHEPESAEKGKSDKGDSRASQKRIQPVTADIITMNIYIETVFIWALIWALGGCLNLQGRKRFSRAIRSIMRGEYQVKEEGKAYEEKDQVDDATEDTSRESLVSIPEDDTLFDYNLVIQSTENIKWVPWSTNLPKFSLPRDKEVSFNSIIVPTVELARTNVVVDVLMKYGHHVLCIGPTGTGKTVSVTNKLSNDLDPNKYINTTLQFSARTSAKDVQEQIDSRLDRRRTGVFAPPIGKKCVIFIDDLNMPRKEEYGAQPPIELLRQWMDHGGWYDLSNNLFRKIIEVQFIAAMGPPGGGRNEVTLRYKRHFNTVSFSPFEADALRDIFSTILNYHFTKITPNAITANSFREFSNSIVSTTVDIYNTISAELLPTPAKAHYTFNLRDLSKVFQGVVHAGLPAESAKQTEPWVRLWAHECLRVFQDRLINNEDKKWFLLTLQSKISQYLGLSWSIDRIQDPIFCDFAEANSRAYIEAPPIENLRDIIDGYLTSYNEDSIAPMDLVLFKSAIEHVTRISRCIKQPRGHALLVGFGGSGRKSLTTLAVHIADYKLVQIENHGSYSVSDWKEDMRRILFCAGAEASEDSKDSGKETVFLFSDTQITDESFLEDINNILNSGEIPGLFGPEEIGAILDACTGAANNASPNGHASNVEIIAYFIERCRVNLRVVLCFSPVGSSFRTRLLNFPSLVNCCYVDWFFDWDGDALLSVADSFLVDVDLDSSMRDGILKICVDMQERVSTLTKDFLATSGRYYYVTPTSYLELIKSFKKLLKEKWDLVDGLRKKFDSGVRKLLNAESQVADMQVELTALQPVLEQATVETDKLMANIKVKREHADRTKHTVELEEKACNDQAEAALNMKTECEEQLAIALPILEAALKALQTLSKSDISEVKSMKKPPPGVKLTMETICIMLGLAPKKVPQQNGKGKSDDYWEVAKRHILGDPKILQKLVAYDKDNIPPEIIEKVEPYTKLDSFTPAEIKKASKASAGLCKWVHAMVQYDKVAKIIAPKREALAKAKIALEDAKLALIEKKKSLDDIVKLLDELVAEYTAANQKKEDLMSQVKDCKTKLGRATKLISGLAGEKTRWTKKCKDLAASLINLAGDILLSSGVVAYLGPFTRKYREQCIKEWVKLLDNEKIPSSSDKYTLAETLGVPVVIRDWCINNLPRDNFSIENAIMLTSSERWPLIIDPQGQANKWIRSSHSDSRLILANQSRPEFSRNLENAVQFGNIMLLEDIGETVNPKLEPLLLKHIFRSNGLDMIKLGESAIEYSTDFYLYMTTRLPNPHFPPEVCVKVNLLNFMATEEGLEDQMLGIVVAKEEPQIEETRGRLIIESAQNQKQLEDLENTILRLLSSSEGNILDDEVLIDTLSKSKVTSSQIEQRVSVAEKMQKKISLSREVYQPIAVRTSLLYFCIADLSLVDPMYQYSLDWFINLSLQCISENGKNSSNVEDGEDKSDDLYIANLNNKLTEKFYSSVCQSLFAKDKLLFSFLLCTKIQQKAGRIDALEISYFLKGSSIMDSQVENPTSWLSENQWNDIVGLSTIPIRFNLANKDTTAKGHVDGKGFCDFFQANLELFENVYKDRDPESRLKRLFEGLTDMQRLVLLRIMRPDKVIHAIRNYIGKSIGEQFVEVPPYDLSANFMDSNCTTPLVFILSPGADPIADLVKLAEKVGFSKKYRMISLGQGQGPIAEREIAEAVDHGRWVVLQNCHLAISWMPALEKICETMVTEEKSTHEDFRLWLTSKPSDSFPVSVLQNGIKITNEPPQGLRSRLRGSYSTLVDQSMIDDASCPDNFEKLVFGLCFFHAIVQERRRYGPLGWNIPYAFTESDLIISISQLCIFEKQYEKIPFNMLSYLVGECNYGGRVTENLDRRTLLAILSDVYCEKALEDSYSFSESGSYFVPPSGSGFMGGLRLIDSFPPIAQPEAFGLHDIADIATATQETNQFLFSFLTLQPKQRNNGGNSADMDLIDITREISRKMPPLFDVEEVSKRYPVKYEQSLNTVLTQEIIRYNHLLSVVINSLTNIEKAIKGFVVMNEELDKIGQAILLGVIPQTWASAGYPSLKSCMSWVNDLEKRIQFFNEWVNFGVPTCFWISGFFFTQSFLTGTLQNFARLKKVPIDELSFDTVIQPSSVTPDKGISVVSGSLIHGLFLDGAWWNPEEMALDEARPKQRFSAMAVVWLRPQETNVVREEKRSYECPVYRTSARSGTLSTTGHSTNYLMNIRIPIKEQHTTKHWVKRGVACICALDT